MSKTRCLIHIVFATKRREMTIPEQHKRRLYAYIMGTVANKGCHLLRINGIGNHIHMLIDLHPSVPLAGLVQTVKQWSSRWIKDMPEFSMFDGWGEGYYAVSVGIESVEAVKRYIINQEIHHAVKAFDDEIQDLAQHSGLDWHEKDLW